MERQKIAVVAIGGNALSDGRSPLEEQMKRAYQAAELIRILVQRKFHVVVVHGNGPQVGVSYLKQLAGMKENLPPLNLALCDAVTQAEIGTLLELAIINTINKEKPDLEVLTIVSQVEVGGDDPAFNNPTKPVGSSYTEEEAKELSLTFPDWIVKEDSGRGYRRVVPSPQPIKIFAGPTIRDAFKTANVIIAGGGGGIPVIRKGDNTFELVDAVIDKDRTSCLLALDVEATHFFLLTGVPHVCINFGKPEEKKLLDISAHEMEEYYRQGHFPPGSMGPKIEAAVEFARKTGGTAIITDSLHIAEALDGTEGTRVHP